ncbi:5-hydroxytryptamine receptor [Anaeramoeba flamelloides]|uniref:5-hydroxytryptamine receptor n=1 Tax=Anaeramoeba flamelloides TaxID=1746091 RepID=A0ABQ8YJL2_9EUKA|nr:5-hydroxytryptamine receptor [Anaeramoeba flamelloides]
MVMVVNFLFGAITIFFACGLPQDKSRNERTGIKEKVDHFYFFIVYYWILAIFWYIPTIFFLGFNIYFEDNDNKPLLLYLYVVFGLVFMSLFVFLCLCYRFCVYYNGLAAKRRKRALEKQAIDLESHLIQRKTSKRSVGNEDSILEFNDDHFHQSRDHLIHALQSISNDDEMKKLIINELEASKLSSSNKKRFALKTTLYLYFKSLSYHYWLSKKNVIKETKCDKCPAYVKEDQGCVCGNSIYCNECSMDHLLFEADLKFEKDPNYWGNNVVKRAFQFVDQFFRSINSIEDII